MARTGGTVRVAALACAGVLLVGACSGDGEPTTPRLTDPVRTGAEQTGDATQIPDPVAATVTGPGDSSATGDADAAQTGTGATADDQGPGTTRTALPRLSLDIPADWQVEDLGPAQSHSARAGQVAPHLWCLVPPEGLAPVDGCGGVVLAVGGDWLPGAGGEPYRPDQAGAWWSGLDEPACPFVQDPGAPEEEEDPEAPEEEDVEAPGDHDPEPAGDEDGPGLDAAQPPDPAATANDGRPLTSQITAVGERQVRYETWRVSCLSSGETLTPQLWHFPELNVLVKDYYGHPDTVAVLHGLQER
jgi:hypothetical protein